jgi:hypothetical protein
VNRGIVVDHQAGSPADRHELLLFLPGTGGKGNGAQGFCRLAADLGYHVVSLMYPDEIAATACDNDANPRSFENFRLAIIAGGQAPYQNGRKTLTVSRADSIENRLVKLLQRLQSLRPKENWEQFLRPDGRVQWPSIAVAGQSQGGGHAALIGIKYRVARVICFGAPKDYSRRLDAPAAWYALPSATPKNRFFAFNHHQDPKGCAPAELLKNLKALGLDASGPGAEVDTEAFPYHHSRILYTGFPVVTVTGQESEGAMTAHTSAINTKNADRWKPEWTYLLTEAEAGK